MLNCIAVTSRDSAGVLVTVAESGFSEPMRLLQSSGLGTAITQRRASLLSSIIDSFLCRAEHFRKTFFPKLNVRLWVTCLRAVTMTMPEATVYE